MKMHETRQRGCWFIRFGDGEYARDGMGRILCWNERYAAVNYAGRYDASERCEVVHED
jgi:hypothetical protein